MSGLSYFEVLSVGVTMLLLCVYNNETLVCRVEIGDSFSGLLDRLCLQWNNLLHDNISLFYSIPEVPKCILTNETDFSGMIGLALSYGLERVRLDVLEKNAIVTPVSSLHDEMYVCDEELDANIAGSFTSSHNRTLKTVGWDTLVTHVGQKFEGGAKEFRQALLKCSIESGFGFKYLKNDSKRVTTVCILKDSSRCDWNVHATVETCNGFMYVRRFNNVHSCGSAFRSLRRKRMGSSLISSLIVDQVRENAKTRPIDLVRQFGMDYGLDVAYRAVWLGVEKAKKVVFGDQSESFDELREYVEAALETNPGSRFVLEVDSSCRFRRLFVSFKACIDGFNHCRPMLFLDGTHLKGKFKGQILSATGKDGNQGLYPFAFCVVDSENEENWCWFLEILKGLLNPARNVTFISDRHPGLIAAMEVVFPSAYHGYCLNHLKMNLKDKFGGRGFTKTLRKRLVWLLVQCAYAPTVQLYSEYMAQLLNEGGGEAKAFFKDLKPEKWANAFFRGKRYGELTSNAAESFNNWILDERELPITSMVDAIRKKIMHLFFDRRAASFEWTSTICPVIEKRLAPFMAEARTLLVVGSYDMTFEVQCTPVVSVDIVDRTCSCRKWQQTGLPCLHAVACIYAEGTHPLSNFFEKFFHVVTYWKSYSPVIYPVLVGSCADLGIPQGSILPPISRRLPGRSKKKRILSRGEKDARPITCGRCGKSGSHNRNGCNAALP